MQEPLVDECGDKPDCKARAEHDPQRQMFSKAYKSDEEKQDAWDYSPQGTFAILGHKGEVLGVVGV